MTKFKCSYCTFKTSTFVDIVSHATVKHPDHPITIRKRKFDEDTCKSYKRITFPVVPKNELDAGRTILAHDDNLTLSVEDLDEVLELPSQVKKVKLDNDDKFIDDNIKMQTAENDSEKDSITFDIKDLNENEKSFAFTILPMLPLVIAYIGEQDQLGPWLLLFKCLANKSLPLDNIAYRLFMDVVAWFSTENSSCMRYSSIVKRFWRTGAQLFKGKFLRFMSGLKNKGQILTNNCSLGYYPTSLSKVNFIVPSKQILDNENNVLKSSCKQPGIMVPLIKEIAMTQESKNSPYKLSIDLKKLNPGGKYGDVDCFGFENSPTFQERQKRYTDEQNVVASVRNEVEVECSSKERILQRIQTLITSLSNRLMDLREMKRKRQYTFDKLRCEAGHKWKESKLAFALSSLQTSLFEIKGAISETLLCTKDLLKACTAMYKMPFPDSNQVDLSTQPNYRCLVGMSEEMKTTYNIPNSVYCTLVKQRTAEWMKIRLTARVTGSTVYKSLGLESLKTEQSHFDENVRGKPKSEPTDEVKKMMDYGSNSEINAIATLTAVIVPTYFPEYSFYEEGCYTIPHESKTLCVVSPDGSLRSNSAPRIAVEIKCPYPKPTSVRVDQYYKPPIRYVLQILMEMFVLKVSRAVLVCWTEETTTVIEMSFSQKLWDIMWCILVDIYGADCPKRPTSLHPRLKELKIELNEYTRTHCKLVCEVPSFVGKSCGHENVDIHEIDDLYLTHQNKELPHLARTEICVSDLLDDTLYRCDKTLAAAYSLCRDVAKQVFVVMLSDMERLYKPELPHSCPIAYGLASYSFTSTQASKILDEVRHVCEQEGLNIVAQCYDGAFAKLAVRGTHDEPLTLLQLSKDVWTSSCKTSKQELIKQISNIGKVNALESFTDVLDLFEIDFTSKNDTFVGPISIGKPKGLDNIPKTPMNWKDLLSKGIDKRTVDEEQDHSTSDCVSNALLQSNENELTEEQENLLSSLIFENRGEISENNEIQMEEIENMEPINTLYKPRYKVNNEDINLMWLSFKELPKRQSCTKEQFLDHIGCAEKLSKLSKHELLRFIQPLLEKAKTVGFRISSNMRKAELVNTISEFVGDGSVMQQDKIQLKQPKSLHSIAKSFLQSKIPKQFLNAAYSSYIFPQEFSKWNNSSIFTDACKIGETNNPSFWFAQPKIVSDTKCILDFLDPEHLLTNTRSKVCSSGMPKAGISSKAWHHVAEHSKENGSNLHPVLVENVLDKQNVAYAIKTFSLEVENAMRSAGYHAEAIFCSLVRNWYRSQDEAGIPSSQRIQYQQELREWLLDGVRFDVFPPPGKYVKDIPIVLYEGLLSNIDRLSQLFALTKGSFNVRSIGTLDIENLFGAFQDWDSKGTGILRSDEVNDAIYTACDLYDTRLNEERFYMHTSAARVYPVPPMIQSDFEISTDNSDVCIPGIDSLRRLKNIEIRNHTFDLPERRVSNPKRKSGVISDIHEPSKGTKGIREEFYKVDESKILPHIRAGIKLDEDSYL